MIKIFLSCLGLKRSNENNLSDLDEKSDETDFSDNDIDVAAHVSNSLDPATESVVSKSHSKDMLTSLYVVPLDLLVYMYVMIKNIQNNKCFQKLRMKQKKQGDSVLFCPAGIRHILG